MELFVTIPRSWQKEMVSSIREGFELSWSIRVEVGVGSRKGKVRGDSEHSLLIAFVFFFH